MIRSVIKKNSVEAPYDFQKIVVAISKSAERCGFPINDINFDIIRQRVEDQLEGQKIPVSKIHAIVEDVLCDLYHKVGISYKDYRNWRKECAETWGHIYRQARETLFLGDRENANFDSSLNSTKGSLIRGYLTKELYKTYEMKSSELEAIEDGYIYIHDLTNLLFRQINCCLFDMKTLLEGGFEMSTIRYNEPKNVLSALQVIGDVTLSATAQQFGGFTIPEIDKTLLPYVKKSIAHYQYEQERYGINDDGYVMSKVVDELYQGVQSLEMKLNTVPCSRGDFAFTTLSFGNISETDPDDIDLQILICKVILNVRMNGQGQNHRPVVFPKLVYLYSEEQHQRSDMKDLFSVAVQCSSKAMYPDYLAIDTEGDVSRIFKTHGVVTSPMGCRAYLSEYLDETGKAIAVGRANIGAVSLNLPMIWMKARETGEDFFDVLTSYMEMIRTFLLRRYEYLSQSPASANPLGFTQGGFYGGTLSPDEEIGELTRTFTASFGITALNELNVLMTGKTLKEYGNSEVKRVVEYINAYISKIKKEDNRLYALYGTPAESLCGTQVKQFRKIYGVIEGVSDRPYFSNSFHLHVSEDITPFEKQDGEVELFHMVPGGHIVYNRIRGRFNIQAMTNIILRGMKLGLYQGVNFDLSTCDCCGWSDENDTEICPVCGGSITTISRLCGYLGVSRSGVGSRMNDAKMAEIADRVSM